MNKQMIVVSAAELCLKGDNRKGFYNQWIRNILRATGLPREQLERGYGQCYLHVEEQEREQVLEKLRYVLGAHSYFCAYRIEQDIDAVEAMVLQLVEKKASAASFKMQTRRKDKTFPMRTHEMNVLLGSAVQKRFPHLKAEMRNPDIEINVEVRTDCVLLYCSQDRVPLGGGLPVGTTGNALLLLSGGIDSPVAGWMAMKRGLSVNGIYFHSFPYTGDRAREKVVALTKELEKWKQRNVHLMVVSFAKVQEEIVRNTPEKYWVLLFRRSMYRIASQIAKAQHYKALVTGENLGQVASQTPENLHVTSEASDMLVLRPLIALNKEEVIQIARKIGTYKHSIEPYEDCCTVFSPKQPSTKGKVDILIKIEQKLNLEELEGEAVKDFV